VRLLISVVFDRKLVTGCALGSHSSGGSPVTSQPRDAGPMALRRGDELLSDLKFERINIDLAGVGLDVAGVALLMWPGKSKRSVARKSCLRKPLLTPTLRRISLRQGIPWRPAPRSS